MRNASKNKKRRRLTLVYRHFRAVEQAGGAFGYSASETHMEMEEKLRFVPDHLAAGGLTSYDAGQVPS